MRTREGCDGEGGGSVGQHLTVRVAWHQERWNATCHADQGHSELSCLLQTMTDEETIRRYLKEHGIDPNAVRKAISRCCGR